MLRNLVLNKIPGLFFRFSVMPLNKWTHYSIFNILFTKIKNREKNKKGVDFHKKGGIIVKNKTRYLDFAEFPGNKLFLQAFSVYD